MNLYILGRCHNQKCTMSFYFLIRFEFRLNVYCCCSSSFDYAICVLLWLVIFKSLIIFVNLFFICDFLVYVLGDPHPEINIISPHKRHQFLLLTNFGLHMAKALNNNNYNKHKHYQQYIVSVLYDTICIVLKSTIPSRSFRKCSWFTTMI